MEIWNQLAPFPGRFSWEFYLSLGGVESVAVDN
jgi:hypothetical protein